MIFLFLQRWFMEMFMDDGYLGFCSWVDVVVLVESIFIFGYVEVGYVGGGCGLVYGFFMQCFVVVQVCGYVV